MKTNNNKKFALEMLSRKSFELNNEDFKCLIEALNENVNKQRFLYVLLRYRKKGYHLHGRLSK